MEEMWLARNRDGKVHLFIDNVAPKKTIDGTWAATGYFPTIIEIPRVYFIPIRGYYEKPTKVELIIPHE